jgi:hypothetical protein
LISGLFSFASKIKKGGIAMRKTVRFMYLALSAIIFFATFATVTAAAQEINVTIDGQAVHFRAQRPAIVDGRTLVPVRGVFEHLGFAVEWEGSTRTATLASTDYTVIISIGSANFTTNSASLTLDVPAQIINETTMLPIRAVVESVGYSVDWNAATNTVLITSPQTVAEAPPRPADTGDRIYLDDNTWVSRSALVDRIGRQQTYHMNPDPWGLDIHTTVANATPIYQGMAQSVRNAVQSEDNLKQLATQFIEGLYTVDHRTINTAWFNPIAPILWTGSTVGDVPADLWFNTTGADRIRDQQLTMTTRFIPTHVYQLPAHAAVSETNPDNIVPLAIRGTMFYQINNTNNTNQWWSTTGRTYVPNVWYQTDIEIRFGISTLNDPWVPQTSTAYITWLDRTRGADGRVEAAREIRYDER